MKTLGELEAAICEGVTRFEQEYMGRGPKSIHTHLMGGSSCSPPRRRLDRRRAATGQVPSCREGEGVAKAGPDAPSRNGPSGPGSDGAGEVTGIKVLSLHHDISTVSGEEVVLFTLAESPDFRVAGKG